MGDSITEYADHLKPNCSNNQDCNICSNYKCSNSKSDLAEMCRKLDFIAQKNIELVNIYKSMHESDIKKLQAKDFATKEIEILRREETKRLSCLYYGEQRNLEESRTRHYSLIQKYENFIKKITVAAERFMEHHTNGQHYKTRIYGYYSLKKLINKAHKENY
jgi:hypothetical protein